MMAGMLFTLPYHALGLSQTQPPFFGVPGRGTLSQDLFFSFTTLLHDWVRQGNLVPPGTRARPSPCLRC
jgi:hypothetical protein